MTLILSIFVFIEDPTDIPSPSQPTSARHTPSYSSSTQYCYLITLSYSTGLSLPTARQAVIFYITKKIEYENEDEDSTETLLPYFSPQSQPRSPTPSISNQGSSVSSEKPDGKFAVNTKLKFKNKYKKTMSPYTTIYNRPTPHLSPLSENPSTVPSILKTSHPSVQTSEEFSESK